MVLELKQPLVHTLKTLSYEQQHRDDRMGDKKSPLFEKIQGSKVSCKFFTEFQRWNISDRHVTILHSHLPNVFS